MPKAAYLPIYSKIIESFKKKLGSRDKKEAAFKGFQGVDIKQPNYIYQVVLRGDRKMCTKGEASGANEFLKK